MRYCSSSPCCFPLFFCCCSPATAAAAVDVEQVGRWKNQQANQASLTKATELTKQLTTNHLSQRQDSIRLLRQQTLSLSLCCPLRNKRQEVGSQISSAQTFTSIRFIISHLTEREREMSSTTSNSTDELEYPIGWQGWYTVAVIVLAFLVLLRDTVPPDFVFLFSLVAVMTAQVVTIQEGLAGFASSAVLSVAVLYAVAAGISGTGALDYVMNKVMGSPTRVSEAQIRLMLPVAFISAFMNNTPVVAVMIPIISQWSRRTGIAPSHLFIPLSFAAILGGTCTLIGTSTNLVLQGRAEESKEFEDISIGIFDVTVVGLPTLFMGFSYILLFSKFLLPTPQTISKREKKRLGEEASSLRNLEQDGDATGFKDGSGLNLIIDDKLTSDDEAYDTFSSGRSLFGKFKRATTTGGMNENVAMPYEGIGSNSGGVFGLLRQAGHVVSPSTPKSIFSPTAIDNVDHNSPHKVPTVVTQYGRVREAYTAGCVVDPHSPVVGLTVEAAGLRGLDGLFLTSVQRENRLLGPQAVGPAFVLSGGDILFFAGLFNNFAEFCEKFEFTPIVNVAHNKDGHGRVGTIDTNVDYVDYMYQRHARSTATLFGSSYEYQNEHQAVDREARLGLSRSPGSGPTTFFRRHNPHLFATRGSSSDGEASCAPKYIAPITAAEAAAVGEHNAKATAVVERSRSSSPTFEREEVLGIGIEMPAYPPSPAFLTGNVIKLRVKKGGALLDATPKEVNFRRRYRAAILSISRDGERIGIASGPGRVVLQAGDVLTLMKGKRFSWENFETCRDLESICAGGSRDVNSQSRRASRSSVSAAGTATTTCEEDDVEPPVGRVRRTVSEASGEAFVAHRDESRDKKNVTNTNNDMKEQQQPLSNFQTDLAVPVSTSSSSRPRMKHARSMDTTTSPSHRRPSDTTPPTKHTTNNASSSPTAVAMSADAVSESEMKQIEREFLFAMRVLDSSKLKGARSLIGLSIEASGLRGLPGLFLVAIDHEDGTFDQAVGSDAVLRKNDVLWFAGDRAAVSTLRRIPGIEAPDDHQLHKLKVHLLQRRLVEAVLSLKSSMIGDTIKKARFRTRFDAAVIAVHRRGERVISKIGDIVLQPGDVLLLDTGPNFLQKFREDPNFLLMSEIENSTPPRFDKFYIALMAIVMMMFGYLFTSKYMSLFQWSVLATFVMLLSGCLTFDTARKSVNWEVIVTIACAFGLSTALQKTNVARAVGTGLVELAQSSGTGEAGVITAIYMATFLLSIVVANNAAALLMFPIALQSANTLNIPLNRMLYTIMLAASSSFASPFGYQTNLMVFGPGGYTFRDFAQFGFPMQFWQMIFSVAFLLLNEIWYICLLASFVFFLVVYFGMKFMDHGKQFVGDAAGFGDVAKDPAVHDIESDKASAQDMGESFHGVDEDKQLLLEVHANDAQEGSSGYVITEHDASEHVTQASKMKNEERECADLEPLIPGTGSSI